MSRVTDRELKKYFCDVSKALICGRKQKKVFISQLEADVEAYLAENEDAEISQIENSFGSPEIIAASFMENVGTEKLKKSLDIKKAMIIAIIAALLIYALFVVISLMDVHDEAHGYIEEGIMMVKNNIWGGEIL